MQKNNSQKSAQRWQQIQSYHMYQTQNQHGCNSGNGNGRGNGNGNGSGSGKDIGNSDGNGKNINGNGNGNNGSKSSGNGNGNVSGGASFRPHFGPNSMSMPMGMPHHQNQHPQNYHSLPPSHTHTSFQHGGNMGNMGNMGMMTMSPHQLCSLQRDNPEAYMLIQQQRMQIYQHRMQLDGALKELSHLRKLVKKQESTNENRNQDNKSGPGYNDNNISNNNSNNISNNNNNNNCDDNKTQNEETKLEDSENVPPAIDVKKTRSTSPSSQLTETSIHESLPTKKRILEAAQNYVSSQQNNSNSNSNINNNNNTKVNNMLDEQHHHNHTQNHSSHRPMKKKRPSLPDLARVAAVLSAATSPHHRDNNSNRLTTPKRSSSGTLPDLATVAATLAAATSPRFKGGIVTSSNTSSSGRGNNSHRASFAF